VQAQRLSTSRLLPLPLPLALLALALLACRLGRPSLPCIVPALWLSLPLLLLLLLPSVLLWREKRSA